MKTMTTFATILAAGMALAPMVANAATIMFNIDDGPMNESFFFDALSVTDTVGQDTPRNAGQRRACDACTLAPTEDGFLEIYSVTETDVTETTLRAAPAELTTTIDRFGPTDPTYEAYGNVFVKGLLEDVVIDEDLAAFYGVPNRGTGQFDMMGSGRLEPWVDAFVSVTVTFSPVPVPAALPLMLTALAGLGLIRWRRAHATA